MRTPADRFDKLNWSEWIPERPDRAIFNFAVYQSFFVLDVRENAGEEAIVIDPQTRGEALIEFPEAEHAIHLWNDEEYTSPGIRITYQSLLTPRTVYDYDVAKHDAQSSQTAARAGLEQKRVYIRATLGGNGRRTGSRYTRVRLFGQTGRNRANDDGSIWFVWDKLRSNIFHYQGLAVAARLDYRDGASSWWRRNGLAMA
jgi:hypothetical protein